MDTVVKQYLERFEVSEATRRFLAKTHKMFIGGEWTLAADEQTIEVIEPSTGGMITRIPLGTTQDLDRAVTAARRQFDGGEWRRMKPLERERLRRGLCRHGVSCGPRFNEICCSRGKKFSLDRSVGRAYYFTLGLD